METHANEEGTGTQLNPGENDSAGNEVVVKKNEGISDQGNEWSADEEGYNESSNEVLGEKAEKYLRESADIEDLPEEADSDHGDQTIKNEAETDRRIAEENENSDDVIEREEDYVPGFDLGRNKVQ